MTHPPGIHAADVTAGTGVRIGAGARIAARTVRLGDNVTIGQGVEISCDTLDLGAETRIGDRARLLSPQIVVGPRCRIGNDLQAEVSERLVFGRLTDIGHSVRIVAHEMTAGDHLWLTDSVRIGGGGARGPRSRLAIGYRCAIMDHCFINLSESVTIGDDTALSNGVVILTHSLWQPLLEGGTTQFAPVQIGSRCILYVNAVVAPGVTIGSDVTVGAGALVLQSVPDASTTVGNPARIMRSTPPVPRTLSPQRRDELMRETLRAWVDTLASKGVIARFADAEDCVFASHHGREDVISFAASSATAYAPAATVTVAFGGPLTGSTASCHFDVIGKTMTGETTPLAEDLRDFLRRRTIRIYTDQPFQPLPPVTIDRLRRQLQAIS